MSLYPLSLEKLDYDASFPGLQVEKTITPYWGGVAERALELDEARKLELGHTSLPNWSFRKVIMRTSFHHRERPLDSARAHTGYVPRFKRNDRQPTFDRTQIVGIKFSEV